MLRGMKNDAETNMISVIMPAYNAERFIAKAIESVLGQEKVYLELIIIDDASVDGTSEVVRTYQNDKRIVYLRNPENYGVAKSRNLGLQKAKGDYVAFLDADDWWQKDKLVRQLELLIHRGAVLCYTSRELYGDDGKSLKKIVHVKESLTYQQLLHSNSIACSSVLIKRDVALEFPMLHDEYHEDYMVWLRCLEKYGIAYGLDEPLLCYRMSQDGKSRNHVKSVAMTYGLHRCMGKNVWLACYYTACHLLSAVRKYL